jgi:type VI secretion system protein VasD
MTKLLSRLLMVGTLLGLVACGGDDEPPPPAPPPPKVVNLTIKAAPDVNPNGAGVPSPVAVDVYQLTSVTAFGESDFFQLQDDAAGALGDELVGSETFVLAPGAVEVYARELGEDVRFLGITAGFRDVSAGKWRSFFAVPPAATTLLEADISGTEVNMRKAGL